MEKGPMLFTEIDDDDDDSQRGPPPTNREISPIVLVNSDSESDDESSIQYSSPPKIRKRMNLNQNIQDNFNHLENKMFTAVFDISTHLGKMVHVQAEIVKTLKGMNDRMDQLISIVKKDKLNGKSDEDSGAQEPEEEGEGVKRKVAKKSQQEANSQTEDIMPPASVTNTAEKNSKTAASVTNTAGSSAEAKTPEKKTPGKQTPLKKKQEKAAIVEEKRTPRKILNRKK